MTTKFSSLDLKDLKNELLILHNGIDNLYPNKNATISPKLATKTPEFTTKYLYKERYQLIKEALIEIVKIYRKNLKLDNKTQQKLTA